VDFQYSVPATYRNKVCGNKF